MRRTALECSRFCLGLGALLVSLAAVGAIEAPEARATAPSFSVAPPTAFAEQQVT